MQLILSHHLSSTSCWASPQPHHVWRNLLFQICIRIQTFVIKTHGRVPIITWRIRTFSPRKFRHGFFPLVPRRAFTFAAWTFWGYLPVSLCLRFRGWRGRWSFLSLSSRICFQTRDHDENYTGLLPNIVQLLSTDSILPLSFLRWLVSLFFDSWLLLLSHLFRSGLWSFASSLSHQYDVLLMSSIWKSSVVIVSNISCSYTANTVWSWTGSCTFDW